MMIRNLFNIALDNSTSFKYKTSRLEKPDHNDKDSNDRSLKKCKNSWSTKIFI